MAQTARRQSSETDSGQASPDGVIETHHAEVACDGGGGALGHPLIYLHMGKDGRAVCPYCSRIFVQKYT